MWYDQNYVLECNIDIFTIWFKEMCGTDGNKYPIIWCLVFSNIHFSFMPDVVIIVGLDVISWLDEPLMYAAGMVQNNIHDNLHPFQRSNPNCAKRKNWKQSQHSFENMRGKKIKIPKWTYPLIW